MDWLKFKLLVLGTGSQKVAEESAANFGAEPSAFQESVNNQQISGQEPTHGWVAAGRDPRSVMTGGLMGVSTLFR